MHLAARLTLVALGLALSPPFDAAATPAVQAPAGRQWSPRERSVLDALAAYERAVLAEDTVALKRIWADDYTFVNGQGVLVTRAQRLANFASGATAILEAVNQREITVRVDGDHAVTTQLFTLRGRFSGQVTDSEVRGVFVWLWRAGRWRLVTNTITPVLP